MGRLPAYEKGKGVTYISTPPTYSALVVDDQHLFGLALAERLRWDGFEAGAVGSVAEAMSALDQHAYDIAFVDLNLPDGNGIELSSELKKRQPQLKVVLITGSAASPDDLITRSQHVDAAIPKPWTPAELESVLRRFRENAW
jgi:two-component system chemotaxis response regulator CheY